MICNAPSWMLYVFNWFDSGQIDIQNMTDIVNWLISKGIIFCSEVV